MQGRIRAWYTVLGPVFRSSKVGSSLESSSVAIGYVSSTIALRSGSNLSRLNAIEKPGPGLVPVLYVKYVLGTGTEEFRKYWTDASTLEMYWLTILVQTPPPLSAESYYENYIKTVGFWGPAAPRAPANLGWNPPFRNVRWWTPHPEFRAWQSRCFKMYCLTIESTVPAKLESMPQTPCLHPF